MGGTDKTRLGCGNPPARPDSLDRITANEVRPGQTCCNVDPVIAGLADETVTQSPPAIEVSHEAKKKAPLTRGRNGAFRRGKKPVTALCFTAFRPTPV